MKTNQMVGPTINGQSATFKFTTRQTLVFDARKAHKDNRAHAEMYGWVQRLVDIAAITRADKDGNVRSALEMERLKWEGIKSAIEHYENAENSEWALKRTASVKVVDFDTIRLACMRAGLSAEKTAALSEEQLKEFAKSKAVGQKILEIQAENIRPAVDADEQFAKLLEA